MNIFVTSLILIFIGIAMFHPAFFMYIDRHVQKGNISRSFLRTNYLIHIVAAIISISLFWIYSVNYPLQLSSLVYLAVIFILILFYWNAELTKWNMFTASVVFGFIVFYRSINEIVEITPLWPGIFTGILGSAALSTLLLIIIALFYRKSSKNIKLIKTLLNFLTLAIGVRIAWDIVLLFNLSVETQYGDIISALKFFWQADSIKLSLTIIFGMFVPIVYLSVFRKTIVNYHQKNGWLIVFMLFASVLTAEFLYKYFLLQYGIVM